MIVDDFSKCLKKIEEVKKKICVEKDQDNKGGEKPPTYGLANNSPKKI